LTKARAELIWTLGERQPLTQRELAALLRVTPRNITTLIDALEATGFVRRDEHPTDRRASAVVLTAQGKKSLAGLQADYAMLADLLFRGISKEDLRVFSRVARLAATRLQAAQP
jgi:DNA-binding MarR family transcriptional regulator